MMIVACQSVGDEMHAWVDDSGSSSVEGMRDLGSATGSVGDSSGDIEGTTSDEAAGSSTGEEEAPRWMPSPVQGLANLDDDDGSGRRDWLEYPFEADNDIAWLALPDHDPSTVVTLTLSGDTAFVRLWSDETTMLMGTGETTITEHTTTLGELPSALRVEFGDYKVDASLHVLLAPPEETPYVVELSLRSAPFVLNHHLQPAEDVWVVSTAIAGYNNQSMVRAYRDALGDKFHAVDIFDYYADVWIQDEFQYATSLAADGTRLDTVIDSIRNRELDPFAEDTFGRLPNWVIGTWGNPNSATSYDSFGNLEVSPPVTVEGVHYPFGRIYFGLVGTEGISGQLAAQLREQGVQAPFQLDTTWLCVGHVDEFVSFVPDESSPKGFRMLYADTRAGYALLDALPNADLPRYRDTHGYASVAQIRDDTALRAYNASMQADYLDANLEVLRRELGLDEADIVRMPSLFERLTDCGGYAAALVPGMVNLIVADDAAGQTHLFIPDPFMRSGATGPDTFIDAFSQRLPVELEPHYVDDWDVYHRGTGEVHCGTNETRTPQASVWDVAMHLW